MPRILLTLSEDQAQRLSLLVADAESDAQARLAREDLPDDRKAGWKLHARALARLRTDLDAHSTEIPDEDWIDIESWAASWLRTTPERAIVEIVREAQCLQPRR